MSHADTTASSLTPQLVVQLLEEALWCGNDDADAAYAAGLGAAAPRDVDCTRHDDASASRTRAHDKVTFDDKEMRYLRAHVFPSLVPALYDLLRLEQRRLDALEQQQQHSQATTSACGRGASSDAAPAAAPNAMTCVRDPLLWVVQHMLRHGYASSADATSATQHPYVLINRATLARAASPPL